MSTIQEQQQIATKSENSDSSPQNTVLSPLAPSSASPTSLQNDEIQTSTSPVMLATMTPVSVDDFPVDYHQAAVVSQVDTAGVGQATDTLDNKQVIYVSTTNGGTHQAILYDPQNPDSLTQGLSMETINTSNGPVSVVIQQPNSLINHTNTSATTYQGPGGATVLVLQELVDDMSSSSATAATVGIKSSTGSTGICSTSTAAALLTGSLKASNGTNSTGLEIGANQLSDLGIFLPHTVASSIKREPEDLSHPQQHRTNPQTGKSSLDQKLSQGRTKVVLVAPGSSSSEIVVDVINGNGDPSPPIKEEYLHSPVGNGNNRSSINGNSASSGGTTSGPLELIATPDGLKPAATAMYSAHVFATQAHPGSGGGGGGGGAGGGSPSPNAYAEHTSQAYVPNSPLAGYITTSTATGRTSAFTDPYYREYFGTDPQSPYGNAQVRQLTTAYADNSATGADNGVVGNSFVERYARQNIYHNSKSVIATPGGLTVDLPSPDSGIGTDTITPRDQAAMQQSFEYEMCQTPLLSEPSATGRTSVGPAGHSPAVATGAPSRSRPWHDFGRQNDADKIQIPKVYSQYGFRFHLETAISTNQRREDDRVTYINKGQFYGITMEYLNDPEKPLKAQTVKSVVMLLFREEKSPEDEIKAWHFWHGRQHSVKQRILDADTKNSAGLVTGIEEVAHNAIAVYWNPLESSAKINIAVQCLSTDFSSQKGVKGLPLHIQIDTYDDPRGEGPVIHRAYCQIKVFCDKGAERKTRDEERRAAKRRLTATGRKKMDELYHTPCERSEFYSMADLTKPPVLFAPAEDIDKLTSMELQTFYHDADASSLSNGETGSLKHTSPFLIHPGTKVNAPPPALKFHNHFPPDSHGEKKDNSLDASLTTDGTVFSSPPPLKRSKMIPPLNERVMLYVRQENEDVYTPLHVAPPTTQGLLNAIQSKYKITSSSISNLYRKNKQGITAKLDDDMLKYYCNEDIFLLEVTHSKDEFLDIYLIELQDH